MRLFGRKTKEEPKKVSLENQIIRIYENSDAPIPSFIYDRLRKILHANPEEFKVVMFDLVRRNILYRGDGVSYLINPREEWKPKR